MCVLYPSGVCAPLTKKSRCVISKISVRDLKNLGAWFGRLTHRDFFVRAATLTVASCKPPFFVPSCKKNSQSEGLREAGEALAFHQFRWSEWGQRRKETEEKVSPHSPFIKRRKRKRRKRGMGSARACVRTSFWRYALSTSPPPLFLFFLIFFWRKRHFFRTKSESGGIIVNEFMS